MSHNQVSVIIPVYNQAQYVGEAIESILNQSHKAHEIIVVNDGSTDDLAPALAPYANSIKLINLEKNQGVAMARNIGLKAAANNSIVFQDADDIAMPERLAESLKALANPETAIVIGKIKPFLDDANISPSDSAGFINKNESFVLGTGSAAIKMKVVEKAGEFNTAIKVGSDLDWFVRVKKSGFTIHKLDKVLLKRRWHKNNLSKISKEDELKLRLQMFRKNLSKK